jgi:hypothetical protein
MSVHGILPRFRLAICRICRVITVIFAVFRVFPGTRRRGAGGVAGSCGIVAWTELRPGRRDGQAGRREDAGAGSVQDAEPPPGKAAADFGFSRQSLYSARAALRERGLAGLVPARPGPKGGHKLTGQVVDVLEDLLAADPGLRPADLAAAVREHFGVSVHPRSVERALQRRRAARPGDGQGGGQAPGAAPKS